MEVLLPIEFIVFGTPVSHQAANRRTKKAWKDRVSEAARKSLAEPFFLTEAPVAVTLFHFPDGAYEGDIDNSIKLVLDALTGHIYVDDWQVERIVVQKFELARTFEFVEPTQMLQQALVAERPVMYVRLSGDPFEDLR